MDGKLIKIITHKRTYRSILFISILCILSSYGIAQTPNYIHYTKADGLPSNHVYGCMQDSKGYIWFFTERGVSKFNGKTFKNFTTKDGLSRNDVWNITEDSEGRLWLHTRNNEINYIRNDSVFTVPVEGEKVLSIYSVSDWEGDVYFNEKFYHWFEKDNVLKSIFNRNEYDNSIIFKNGGYQFRAGLNNDTVLVKVDSLSFYFLKTKNNELLDSVVFTDGIDLPKAFLEKVEVFKSIIFSIDEEMKNIILVNLKSRSYSSIPFTDFFMDDIDRVRFAVTDKSLQIQTNLGLILVNKDLEFSYKSHNSSILNNDISRSFLDKGDNFWINTRNDGVYLITNDAQRLQSDRFIKSNDQIVDMQIRNSHLYIGIESGVIKKYSLRDINLESELDLRTKVSGFLKFNNEFIVFNVGVDPVIVSDKLEIITQRDYLSNSKVKVEYSLNPSMIFREGISDGNLSSTNFYLKSAAVLNIYKSELNYFSYREQRSVGSMELFENHFFFTIKNKVFYFENETERHLRTFEDDIVGLKKIGDKLIIMTSDGKIYTMKDFKVQKIFSLDLDCLEFCKLRDDEICILTSESLIKYNFISNISTKIIDLDLFSGSEFNKIVANDELIIASANDGIHFIEYKDIDQKRKPPTLLLNRSTSNGTPITNEEKLSYSKNDIILKYDLISFNSMGKHKIYNKLLKEGKVILDYNKTEKGNIEYNNLKSGSYNVRVKGEDTFGNVSGIQNFKFTISKPYWQTVWFYCLIFLSSSLTFYYLGKLIVKRTERRKDIEFKSKLKLAELELAALQSQLNPHFIFNAMGSIQALIQAKRVEEADEYLAKFSRLMRRFLISSKSKFIKLVHELEIIQDYVEIEKLRYDNFDFEISVDPIIDILSLQVPSLFIQPFVENAIAHGLFHNKKKGSLKIIIAEEGDGLALKIEDNGIGRAASKLINDQSVSNYKSLGVSLIKDRLATLNSISDKPYRFSIDDLEQGTRVNLWIPYNNKSAA